MRIVWLLPYLPLPVTTGGRRRVLNLVRLLSTSHEITLVAYWRGESEREVSAVRQLVNKLFVVSRRPTTSALNVLLWMIGPWPFMAVANGFNRRMASSLKLAITEAEPDVVQCEHFHMWQVLAAARSPGWPPVLLAEQGVESLVTKRFLAAAPFLQRLGLRIDLTKAKKWEREAYLSADGLIAVSEGDRKLISQRAPSVRSWVVENGVDTELFSPDPTARLRKPDVLLFIGTFSFFGNRDALRYICRDILPGVRERRPGARLKVIGERPPLVDVEGVEFLGSVRDVVPYLREASLLLAPLRTGSGTKLKILEAMACGLPFVTTDYGLEGLEGAAGAGFVANTPRSLIDAAVRVLEDPALAKRLGQRGRAIVEAGYSWERSARALEQAWTEITSG